MMLSDLSPAFTTTQLSSTLSTSAVMTPPSRISLRISLSSSRAANESPPADVWGVCADVGGRCQDRLGRGVREADRAHVAAVGHEPGGPPDRPLAGEQRLAQPG